MNPKNQQQMIIIGIIAVVAVIAVGAVIFLSGTPQASADLFKDIPFSSTGDGGFVVGNPDAPITIVEFADFACPACMQYKPTMDRFITEYVRTGQAKFEFRVLPTAGGAVTDFAGRLAQCADEQRPGAFWDAYAFFYNKAFSGGYRDNNLGSQFATQVGMDYADLIECSEEADIIQQNQALAQRIGAGGTPAVAMRVGDGPLQWISIGGQQYDQGGVPFEILSQAVASA
jgi:protein-disulfide isomerase